MRYCCLLQQDTCCLNLVKTVLIIVKPIIIIITNQSLHRLLRGSRSSRLPDFQTVGYGGKVVIPTLRPTLSPRKYSWYSFLRGSNPGGSEFFRTRPKRPWGPPSLIYSGYLLFQGWGLMAGALRGQPTPSSAELKRKSITVFLLSKKSRRRWPHEWPKHVGNHNKNKNISIKLKCICWSLIHFVYFEIYSSEIE